ncbi:MAG: thioredoxin [candidate division FCPU426 bacterium]
MAVDITSEQFTQEVEQAAGTILVDFYADWCAPCRMVAPILEEIARERPGVKIVKVNVDRAQELAERFTIMSIPTLLLFSGGKRLASWVGLRPKPLLLSEIDQALAKK